MQSIPADASNSMLLLINLAGEIFYATSRCADMLGFAPDEVVGRSTLHLIHPGDRKRARRVFQAVLATPDLPRRIELRLRNTALRWCWVEGTLTNCIAEPHVGGIVVHCRDVSVSREAGDREKREKAERLRSIARLEDCLHAVAHDFREPLRTISLFTGLLVKQAVLGAESTQYAHFVLDGVGRMSKLFERIYDSAIRDVDDPVRPVDLKSVIAEVLLDLRYAIADSRALITTGPLPVVQGNEKYLARVFQNLIANAVKYRSETPIAIHIAGEQLGPHWIMKIKDNGLGIASEDRERVFRLSERLHGSEIEGKGIGLANCKTMVESMGGSIWVESSAGSGSTFCFTVAAVRQAGADQAAPRGESHCAATPCYAGEIFSIINIAPRALLQRVKNGA